MKLYHAECKAARANHTDPPPHYLHNKVGWKKWREAQQVKHLGGLGRGVIGDLLAQQQRDDQRRLERQSRLH